MKKIFLLLCLFLFLPFFTFSQSTNFGGFINIRVLPSTPQPGDRVVVSVESVSTDLNKSEIIWMKNGLTTQRGTGLTDYAFTAGKAGEKTNITITVTTPDGIPIQKQITIEPGDVDLLWEAYSYVPAFYKGKALYPYQGTVKVVAVPHMKDGNGLGIPQEKLDYKWTKDDTVLGDLSGHGKNILILNGSVILDPTEIKVEVTSAESDAQAVQTLTLTPVAPQVLFYQNNPLFGTQYESPLFDTFTLQKPEITLRAIPFFFSVANRLFPNINFTWGINNDQAYPSGRKNEITLRRQAEAEGTADVSLSLENTDEILQSAGQNLSIIMSSSDQKASAPF